MRRLHPTIVVGYGPYGLRALRRFLTDASEHGMLSWDEAIGDEAEQGRRLRSLALVWVPDDPAAEVPAAEGDLARDLYRQIREVRPAAEMEHESGWHGSAQQELTAVLVSERRRLLRPRARGEESSRLRLGLDVFILAQPTGLEVLGALEGLLPGAMDELGNDPGLRTTASGAELLNFALFCDFENYWDHSSAGREMRRQFREFVRRWQARGRSGAPGIGRIYLTHGHSGQEYRDEALRTEETAIFLELLLFEGMREEEMLRRLYQSGADDSAPLSSYAVRVMERSRGLLSRLAAARFAAGWLEYLAGTQPAQPAESLEKLRGRLAQFRPDDLDLSETKANLAVLVEKGIAGIEGDLKLLSPDSETWAADVRAHASESALRLKNEIANWVGEMTRTMAEQRLAGLRGGLEAAITGSLHDATCPATLGQVIAEIASIQQELRKVDLPAPLLDGADDDSFEGVDEAHGEYRHFKWGQLSPAGFLEFWPILAGALAVAWAPILRDGVEALSAPGQDAAEPLQAGYTALTWLAKPLVGGPVTLLLAWLTGRAIFQRQIGRRVAHSLLAYTHPERGSLVGSVRKALRSGALRSGIQSHAEQVFRQMVVRLRSDVQRELSRALNALYDRQREIQWMIPRLQDFLRSHGLEPHRPDSGFDTTAARRPSYRHAIERDADLGRMLKRNAATPARFESTQAERKPFLGWAQRYCGTFLNPVDFLEQLGQEYERASLSSTPQDADLEGLREDDFAAFLQRFDRFAPSVGWSAEHGAAASLTESTCLLPDSWYRIPTVKQSLREREFTEMRTLLIDNPDRCYLLRVDLAIPPDRLSEGRDG